MKKRIKEKKESDAFIPTPLPPKFERKFSLKKSISIAPKQKQPVIEFKNDTLNSYFNVTPKPETPTKRVKFSEVNEVLIVEDKVV